MPPAQFVTHLNRRAVDRQYAILIAIWGGLAVVGVLGFASLVTFNPNAGAAAAGPLLFTVICLPNLIVYIFVWRRTRAMSEPLVVSRRGLAVQTPRGNLSVPWAGIAGIDLVRRIGVAHLCVRLRPEVGPGAAGIESTLSTGGWRLIRRQGLWISTRVLTEPAPQLTRAIADFSGGRFALNAG